MRADIRERHAKGEALYAIARSIQQQWAPGANVASLRQQIKRYLEREDIVATNKDPEVIENVVRILEGSVGDFNLLEQLHNQVLLQTDRLNKAMRWESKAPSTLKQVTEEMMVLQSFIKDLGNWQLKMGLIRPVIPGDKDEALVEDELLNKIRINREVEAATKEAILALAELGYEPKENSKGSS